MVNEKKCRIEDGQIICEEEKPQTEDKKPPVKKEPREKCEFLVDSKTGQKLEVCTKNGKPSSARMLSGNFQRESDE